MGSGGKSENGQVDPTDDTDGRTRKVYIRERPERWIYKVIYSVYRGTKGDQRDLEVEYHEPVTILHPIGTPRTKENLRLYDTVILLYVCARRCLPSGEIFQVVWVNQGQEL